MRKKYSFLWLALFLAAFVLMAGGCVGGDGDEGYSSGEGEGSGPPPATAPKPEGPATAPAPEGAVLVYKGRTVDAFRGWSGYTAFELDNGTVWHQADNYHSRGSIYASYAIMEIYQDESGFYVSYSGEFIRVEQVTDEAVVTKSKIRETFFGWGKDEIIQLQDGTAWQQLGEFIYNFYTAYQPDVLVFKEGDSYYAFVKGSCDAVPVKKLK